MSKQLDRVIMLADCQSFYASVEKAAHPEYKNKPLVVAGDPTRRSGIILAACPIAKKHGITTAERLGEALAKCPEVVVIRPRMEEYIRVSLQITEILQSYTDLVEPYSIDEQHLDITASLKLFGSPVTIAKNIQQRVMNETGVRTRIGISYCKVVSKMACDNFAKKNERGIFTLSKVDLPTILWPLPVNKMFMVGSRMTQHLTRMGIMTIGDLANTSLTTLKRKWGINGEVLWCIANGIDSSPVSPNTHNHQKVIGHQMTLPRDYYTLQEILVPLLELSELVCQRCRAKGYMGWVVSVGCRGADFNRPTGFHRQMTLTDPTSLTGDVYKAATMLLERHWDGSPIRSIGVSLSQLVSDEEFQLVLFDDREKKLALEKTTDMIKQRFGNASIMRAVSLTKAGQAKDRSQKIGGHYK
ncbi:DNA polymerase IV [Brevibacillus sp. DP1.3A]|uniref:DNA polymerase IV n=1 Tax=Brevibacillus sp. DP1.3A TaxID=2738867 RepID=UPI00156B4FCA|nr:DNA polymerase IV [Brevibacillus sp. DP1.3A]MED1916923.1 DNA polymerase IV [Bacillus thuringiensis]UED77220.1 DNA polymerase IV [Brevibacillus sp. DP1.3A]